MIYISPLHTLLFKKETCCLLGPLRCNNYLHQRTSKLHLTLQELQNRICIAATLVLLRESILAEEEAGIALHLRKLLEDWDIGLAVNDLDLDRLAVDFAVLAGHILDQRLHRLAMGAPLGIHEVELCATGVCEALRGVDGVH